MAMLTSRRSLLGLGALVVVALLGAAAAFGYAFSSVEQDNYVFTYRPADTDSFDGALPDPAVAPLALARSAPDELHVVLPCEATEPASSFSSLNLDLWASTGDEERSALRFPDLPEPVRITLSNGVLSVMVGRGEVLSTSVESRLGCSVQVHYQDGQWGAVGGGTDVSAAGPGPGFAEAVFSGPAASSKTSEVTVRTRELGSSPSGVQLLFLGLAILSLVVVGREIWARGGKPVGSNAPPVSSLSSRLRKPVRAPDFIVLGGLMAWMLFIPLNIDDGWIAAWVDFYPDQGDFTGVFAVGSAPIPFGYWLEWLRYLWQALGTQPVLMRLPALVLGVSTWIGLRSIGRSLQVREAGAAMWVMAGVFLVGFGAWGFTARPEPVIAALVIASLALAIRFDRGERGWVVVVWIAVIALAATAHPAGIVVVAPALASWRSLWAWGRTNRESGHVAVAALLALGTLVLLLFFIDSNVSTKLDSIDAFRTDAHSLSILDEPDRYDLLDETPYATPMRRVAVGSIVLGLGAFLLGRRRGEGAVSLPGWSLLVALALLTLTPSKWPWHFGGLLGLSALVLAIGLGRLRSFRAGVALAGIGAVMAWAWAESLGWAPFDLRVYRWFPGARNLLPFSLASLVTWTVLVSLVLAWGRWRAESHWSPPETLAVLAVGLVVLVTGSTLVLDTVRTNGWTFGRQNLLSLIGQAGCGLGDEVLIPVPGSLHALPALAEQTSSNADRVAGELGYAGGGVFDAVGYPGTGINKALPVEGMTGFGSWVETEGATAEANLGSYRSDWHVIGVDDNVVAVMVMGRYSDSRVDNEVGVQWGVADGADVIDLGVDQADQLTGFFLDWRMVEFTPPPGADRVRTLVRDETAGSANAWVAASTPLGFATATVGDVAAGDDESRILIAPAISPYFPCVDVPRVVDTVVPKPSVIIQTWRELWQTTYAAAAASDRYFLIDVDLDPPLQSEQIGAHTGDVDNFIFVSQEYLTGVPSRANGTFAQGEE